METVSDFIFLGSKITADRPRRTPAPSGARGLIPLAGGSGQNLTIPKFLGTFCTRRFLRDCSPVRLSFCLVQSLPALRPQVSLSRVGEGRSPGSAQCGGQRLGPSVLLAHRSFAELPGAPALRVRLPG